MLTLRRMKTSSRHATNAVDLGEVSSSTAISIFWRLPSNFDSILGKDGQARYIRARKSTSSHGCSLCLRRRLVVGIDRMATSSRIGASLDTGHKPLFWSELRPTMTFSKYCAAVPHTRSKSAQLRAVPSAIHPEVKSLFKAVRNGRTVCKLVMYSRCFLIDSP